MDLDFWDCFGMKKKKKNKTLSYNQRNTITVLKCLSEQTVAANLIVVNQGLHCMLTDL